MTRLVLILVCHAIACSEPHAIATINPVIGDTSFVVERGRAPTADDPFDDRIRAHLAYAEARLRERDVRALAPELRAARTRLLDHLNDYQNAGAFPAGESSEGLQPTFVDGDGRRCAVAYLVEQTAGTAAMLAIDARHHTDFIAEMDAPELAAWTARSGLTRDELAMIQPAYPPTPPKLHYRVGAEYRHPVDDAAIDPAAARLDSTDGGDIGLLTGSVRAILPHNRWIGGGLVRVDGAVGRTSDGDLAYAAHLRLGSGFAPKWRWLFHAGITAGIGVDAIGEAIPRALTAPVELFWYAQTGEVTRLGLFGGPSYSVDGERSHGWSGGLDFVWTRDYEGPGPLSPRAIHFTLALQEVADVRFAGLAISLATRSVLGYIPW